MKSAIFFILALHSIAAVITLVKATRDEGGFLSSLRWGGLGFVTGVLGLITRRRIDRRNLGYHQVLQDAFLNFGLELFAVFGLPQILKF
jgi:nitrate reductase gamma subunit